MLFQYLLCIFVTSWIATQAEAEAASILSALGSSPNKTSTQAKAELAIASTLYPPYSSNERVECQPSCYIQRLRGTKRSLPRELKPVFLSLELIIDESCEQILLV